MDCFLCHRSTWMQKKSFGFLKKLLDNYKERIRNEDVFRLLECDGSEPLLAKLEREIFPADIIEKMQENRSRNLLQELENVTYGLPRDSGDYGTKMDYVIKYMPFFQRSSRMPWQLLGESLASLTSSMKKCLNSSKP
jgi:hypothetical protein